MKKCTASVLVMSYNARNSGKNLDTKESTHTHTQTDGARLRAEPAPLFTANKLLPCGGAGRGEGARAEITKRWEVN